MTIAILTIGDEICIGQTVNTNAAWIADACAREGWRVVAHSVVGDDLQSIIAEFQRLLTIADVVLITGGLGPTHDDRTKTALLQFLNDTLEQDAATLEHLRELFRVRGRELTPRNAEQAMLPKRCEALRNEQGTAPGMWFRLKAGEAPNPSVECDKFMAALPGVPHEMKHLMQERVLPRLREIYSTERVMMYTTLMTTGIAESNLADIIGDPSTLLEGQELAFLPSPQGVRMRITVNAPNRAEGIAALDRIESRLREKAGRYIYGKDGEGYEAIVARALKESGLTVAVAESCTGGLLGAALTETPGASAYFLGGVQCYSNEAKIRFCGVKPETLRLCGAVSKETALELAVGIRSAFQSDIGVSITGVAGPDGGTPEKPVGTVWIGIAEANGAKAHTFSVGTERAVNRERAIAAALQLLYASVRTS